METNKLIEMNDIVESTKGVFDMDGICWTNRTFSHPERTIRVATSFSGIGAPERALERLGLNTQIVFACDIGERYLDYNYKRLAQFTVGLSEEEKQLFAQHLYEKNEKKVNEKRKKGYKNAGTTNPFTLEEVKENLYGDKISEPKVNLELVKECIDIITRHMSHSERECFVSNLFDEKGRNYIKDAFFANHDIKEENWHTDIRYMDASPYKGQVDLYVGGSPCCSFSKSGLRLALEDTRGTLFYDFAKRIKECEPKVFVYENVASMINAKKGKTSGLEVALSVFQKLGYKVYWQILNAKDYGMPQNRERVWVIGFREDIAQNVDFKYPAPIPLKSRLYDYLDSDILPRSGWVDKPYVRELTGTECLRLMGFHDFNIPDSFYKNLETDKSRNTKMCEMAGNSMVVECLMALFLQMDITKYGVDLNDPRNYIQTKSIGEMTTKELEEHIDKCIKVLNGKYETHDLPLDDKNISFADENNDYTFSRSWDNIDWGLVDSASLVPVSDSSAEVIYIGATNVSTTQGHAYQGSKVDSTRGISRCILKRHSPIIIVSNEVRPYTIPEENETSHSIDWGLIDVKSKICIENGKDSLFKIGETGGHQSDRVYGVRALSPTIVKWGPPKIIVSNMVNHSQNESGGSYVAELNVKQSA